MKAKLKLICPLCEKLFTTHKSNRVWCKDECREKHERVKALVKDNHKKQETFKNEYLEYNFKRDTFFIKGWETANQEQRKELIQKAYKYV